MEKKITDSKWFYILLSVLMAFALWVYIGKEANPINTGTISNVKVVFSGMEVLEERGLMISQGASQTISLNIQARRDVFTRLNQGEITVTIDVSGITEPGEQTVPITTRLISYPRSITSTDAIELRYTSPSAVTFTVSRWASKEVEVRGVFEGSVAQGYQRGEFAITPGTVTISGQEEVVSQVEYAQVTVSQQEMTGTYSQQCSYTLMDAAGNPIAHTGVLATDPQKVLVELPVVVLKKVPLTVNLIDGGGATADNARVSFSPTEFIMVAGDEADLEGLKEISLGDIALSDIYTTETFVKKIELAPELSNVSGITEVEVTVEVEGLSTRTMRVDNIEIINTPAGYVPEAITKACSVLIRGSEEAVSQVQDSQLRIVADLSNTDPSTGSRTVPVKVYLDGSSDVGVVGTYTIVVSLS